MLKLQHLLISLYALPMCINQDSNLLFQNMSLCISGCRAFSTLTTQRCYGRGTTSHSALDPTNSKATFIQEMRLGKGLKFFFLNMSNPMAIEMELFPLPVFFPIGLAGDFSFLQALQAICIYLILYSD